jgi:hypothetical protein
MSVLVQGEGQQLLLTKGAPESVLSRCSSALANSEPPPTGGAGSAGSSGIATGGRQVVPLTESMRRSLMERMGQYGGGFGMHFFSACSRRGSARGGLGIALFCCGVCRSCTAAKWGRVMTLCACPCA